jgi:hypothetical protein
MSTSTLNNAPDLRTGFPRSPNASLGCFVILPRIIDKCRALVAGTIGEYNYNCPLDRRFFDYTGVDADVLKDQVAAGKSDEELLAWIKGNSKALTDDQIRAWSYRMRWMRPETDEMKAYFEALRESIAPENYAIETWFQLLDVEEKRI